MSATAAVVALLSAVSYAGSTSLQHHATQQTPSSVRGSWGLLVHLLGRPAWLVGQALAVTGLALHAAALHVGPIALVQPVVIAGVVLAVPARAALGGRRPCPRELLAVAVTAAGLATFLQVARPREGTPAPATLTAVGLCAAGLALVAATVALARRTGQLPHRAFLLGAAAGVLFGLVAGLMKAVLHVATTQGPGALPASWATWALLVVGGTGIVTQLHAYRLARLSASMPVLNVANGSVALAFGVLAFHEVPRHAPADLLLELVALGAVATGLVLAARVEDDEPVAPAPRRECGAV